MENALNSNPFAITLVLVFLAELGDKTQLIALAFATRYRMSLVIAGTVIGTVTVTGVSVGIGATIGAVIAEHWLEIITGGLLIVFAVLIARGTHDEGGSERRLPGFGPVIGVAVTFFVAEIGDKTMLATIGLAAQSDSYVLVWAGASMGMILANIVGISIGRFAGRNLPENVIRWIAATLFFASGVMITIGGVSTLRSLH